ncbi:hypothetical protein [Amycolatopsis jejuensis]|uniref:hypothetical protein n=1 Tax=Amycolatopsis jejuensis TaxID=330084 RepID=UPI00068DE864|nr:hypothetical protein [Amycolatopsis jejuensis]
MAREGVGPRVEKLRSVVDNRTPTGELLAHARVEAERYGLDDYFVVDADSHREPTANWSEVIEYIENPVIRRNSRAHHELDSRRHAYVAAASPVGFNWQAMFGRIAHEANQQFEPVTDATTYREVVLARRAMDAMGIDVQVIFPTVLLGMGMSPVAEGEAQIAYAYDKWFIENVCTAEARIKFMPYLPLRSPEMCVRIIEETAGARAWSATW